MDHHTIYTTYGFLILFMGTAASLAYRTMQSGRRDRAALWFCAAAWCGGGGLLLITREPRLEKAAGTILFLGFQPLLHLAIGAATRQSVRRSFGWMVVLQAMGVGGMTAIGNLAPQSMLRILPVLAALILMAALNVHLLLRQKHSPTLLANRTMAAFLTLHIALLMLHGVVLWAPVLAALLTYSGMACIVGIGVSFLGVEALRSRAELERLAMTDPLTGLFNRRALEALAPRELTRCIRCDKPCSAMMLDIDHFKQINDTLGHAAGDASLQAVAGVLQSLLRPSDVITRYGGDEFFVLLPECTEEQAALVVARLRQAIAASTLSVLGGASLPLEVSIGLVTRQCDTMTIGDLVHASDSNLYLERQQARRSGIRQVADGSVDGGGAQVHPSST